MSSVSDLILSDYFYPFNQLTNEDFAHHRFIKSPQQCCVTSAFVQNGNYAPIFDALKIDKLKLLKKLVESKDFPEIWLKFLSKIEYETFMFFNIDVKYGYKVAAGIKAVYGHNALLIIPSKDDKTIEISKYVQTHFRQETLISKFFECFFIPINFVFPKTKSRLRHDTTVNLLFDLNKEFKVSLFDALKDFKTLLQKPLQLIGLDPREISTSNISEQQKAEAIIDIILIGLKIKELIKNDFHSKIQMQKQTFQNQKDLNAIIAEISTNQLNLSTAIVAKRSTKAQNVVPAIYQNLDNLLQCIFQQYGTYFADNFENDSTIIFPKIPFTENLFDDLKIIHSLLKQNFAILDGKLLFKWNESTKQKMMVVSDDESFERFGITVTEDSFDMIKQFYDNFDGNVFWALNLESNFNNIEPLLFINNRETLFGFAETLTMAGNPSSDEQIGDGKELYFATCGCNNLQYRFWICKSCSNLFKIGDVDNILCGCGYQKVNELKKECFQCMFISKGRRETTNGQFKEARDQLSTFFKSNISMETKPQKIKKDEIVPPDPHNNPPEISKLPVVNLPPPPPLPSQAPLLQSPLSLPIVAKIPLSPITGDITAALEQLHETVKVATELCDDVLQKVSKKDIGEPSIEIQHPELVAAVEEPPGEPLEALRQKVEEALEYVEEIKEREESRTNSSA